MKNKTTSFIVYIVLSGILVSCSGGKKGLKNSLSISKLNKNENIISIDLDQNIAKNGYNIQYTSFLFKKATPVILETTPESLLSSIDKIAVYNDLILVIDFRVAKGVFAFNKTGEFVRRIGRIGDGPGEYIRPSDFTIDTDNQLLYIIDNQRKINCYRLPGGEFISSVKLQDENIRSNYIQYYNGKMYADANSYVDVEDECMLREIDLKTGKQTACWLSNKEYNKGFNCRHGDNIFFTAENPFYDSPYSGPKFVQSCMDTIIALDKNGVVPFLSVKSENFITTEDIQKARKNDGNSEISLSSRLTQMKKVYQIRDYVEGRDFIYFEYSTSTQIGTVMYNTKENSTDFVSFILDDLIYKTNFDKQEFGILPDFIYSDKDGIYGYVDMHFMEEFIRHVHEGKLNLDNIQVEKLMKLTEDSNPILFYYEYE
ncbi:6-bladed beta-propeller [Dysgonomonas reticulitermitis]